MSDNFWGVSLDQVYDSLQDQIDKERTPSIGEMFIVNVGILERLDMLVKLKMGELGITKEQVTELFSNES